jgi:hypothetical protein
MRLGSSVFEWPSCVCLQTRLGALAHASEGGKCKMWEKWPLGQPKAGGSEYLELHGVFPSPCARQEQRSSGLVGSVLGGLHARIGTAEQSEVYKVELKTGIYP